MGARRGHEVLERFRAHPAQVWHRGVRVQDVTSEPGLANGVRSLAGLYDFQWQQANVTLETDPLTDQKVARSFSIPRTPTELERVGAAMLRSSEYSMGMMGREPSYLNRAMSAYAGAAEFFRDGDRAYGDNVTQYHRYLRANDLSLTHTLLNPRPNRLAGPARQADPLLAAHVHEERDDGLVIRGARMLATLPLSDELMVFPARLPDGPEESARYAFAFAIPTATPGLKFICRDSVDYGFNGFDHPLGSRFEEMDAVVIFDDVLVPWERVFCYRDVNICNAAAVRTGALAQMAYQVVCKNIAKTEFLLGLASMMVDGSGLESFQHIHEKIAEVWVNLTTLKAFKRASESDAQANEYGVFTPAWDPLDASRNLYPRLYPRMVEIIQQIGASGLVAMPTQADLDGALGDEIRYYYQSARLEASERIPLYRLAWDAAVSAFGSRQVLYERFFFGDPVQMASAVFKDKDRSGSIEKVRRLLQESHRFGH
ncbi:4-hydroxyphenylacetate 3-monooxygenase, oxygenase component [Paraburkholderia madseniana]|uniref:4-hydroxyphenylacetate 3-monooxygenase, oxygenase component n=1 Tax=Paraburkholderia madseniana TaxID=2599607 RepID=A0A6N6WG46_9BURK|nr:4-hydroxyphenylacetate 3-monooxygenase, oxygenase component [Paraburkholderia madseniana]KAE8758420.1 4-hydroxyphenylacetate 3-monooxygenase, oxygenase component [Paraburkholderia madseniana]